MRRPTLIPICKKSLARDLNSEQQSLILNIFYTPEKRVVTWQRRYGFPLEMKSEKWAQKFHTDDASLPSSVTAVFNMGN